MQQIDFDFWWPVAESYEIRPLPRPAGTKSGMMDGEPIVPFMIVPVGETVRKAPLAENPSLAMFLLETYRRLDGCEDRLQQTVLRFASQYGLLGSGNAGDGGESLDMWYYMLDSLRAVRRSFQFGDWSIAEKELRIANLRVVLVPDPLTDEPRVSYRPFSLADAIMLQMAQKLCSGTRSATCQGCGGAFDAGPHGRRIDSKFCSESCRTTYHNRRRRRPKPPS